MIFDGACTLSAQREEGKPRSYVPQEVSHVNAFENALSVSNTIIKQDQDMKCKLKNLVRRNLTSNLQVICKNLASAKLSVVTFLFTLVAWAFIVGPPLGWAEPSDALKGVSQSGDMLRGQPHHSGGQGKVSFKVVDVKRPVTRWGRRLSAPRYIYLMASRSPSRAEARRLARSEKRALRKSRKSRKPRKPRQPELAPRATGVRPWEGRYLGVYRLGPAQAREFPTQVHLDYFDQLRAYEQRLIDERDAHLAEISRGGSPIALSTPKASPDLLESSDDDDELSGAEEGEICGHQGEPCCQTTQRGSCDTGLMCVKGSCQPPPTPCGGFEQECCAEAPACRRTGLICLPDEGGAQACLMPPPLPERLKTPVGVVEIIEVNGPLVKAVVRSDALKSRRRRARPLNAIYLGDEATWYR